MNKSSRRPVFIILAGTSEMGQTEVQNSQIRMITQRTKTVPSFVTNKYLEHFGSDSQNLTQQNV